MVFWLWLALVLAAETTAIVAVCFATSRTPVLLILLPTIPLTLLAAIALREKLDSVSGQARKLSPQAITGQREMEAHPTSALELCGSIVERAVEIRRAMASKEPPSEMQVEMCALGYMACADDMITLTHLINEELATAGPLRRLRLRRCRRRATDALSLAREALPTGALRATRHETQ